MTKSKYLLLKKLKKHKKILSRIHFMLIGEKNKINTLKDEYYKPLLLINEALQKRDEKLIKTLDEMIFLLLKEIK